MKVGGPFGDSTEFVRSGEMTTLKMMIVLALALDVAFVQSYAQQPEAKKMAEMMKATQPSERHKQLEPLAGSWDVLVRFKYGPGPERQGKAKSEAKWILGGRFLQQEYQSESGQVTLQFIGYDNQKKKFFEIKMDNMDTGVLYTEGTLSEDGKVITNVGERTDPVTGEKKGIRTVTTFVDKDHYTVEWFQPYREGNDQKVVTMILTRRGSQ
jgi:Protein of unknown function (DUF1579)